ncbi:hypothetical protein GCM10008090_27440 [Arenicella chitinivorans]|uniref:YdhG-like domain-containing protein n=1 Tax=Arenicella chitinivorans TaxID=1329800 RepID=A0A918VQ82_9GAMM|nr:DUF1801 domain-containing protein [Arenicella chitinivorans]GHA16153.1 hypothetical protein GCM10008090_27440 [Arenicella chitinivorans]
MDTYAFSDQAVADVFSSYPESAALKLLALRHLLLQTADSVVGLDNVTETLKWGEPSYLCPTGSTVRMDWKPKSPEHYALYFHCQTTLVETFRELYRDELEFDGKRAILFHLKAQLPTTAVAHCIELALSYHHRKRLPLLGAFQEV